jgi:putative hydrolase of the HAD superfamily
MALGILAICLDCGDTLVDEGTEIKDETGVALRAELIPGAAQMVRELKQRGYRLALVADGPAGTFHNLLKQQHQLFDLFDAWAISGELGVEKPHPHMFRHVLNRLDIPQADYGRTVMVGNNLARDIKGANALGMISIWLDWAPRRPKVPADESEAPHHTIKTPLELLLLIESLEKSLAINPTGLK